jgi:hypothetical protein
VFALPCKIATISLKEFSRLFLLGDGGKDNYVGVIKEPECKVNEGSLS